MKRLLKILMSGVLSGIFIGLGVLVYLSTYQINKITASLLFAFGLYGILSFELFLYTGKVCFILDNKPKYFLDLLFGLVGNLFGIVSLCFLLKLTRVGSFLKEQAEPIVNMKQNDTWYSILILSILCGFMIYLAVKGFRELKSNFGKAIMSFLAVSLFILCGFEHCIANAGYYTIASIFNLKSFLYFIIMIVGNCLGSVILDSIFKFFYYLKKKSEEEVKEC